MLTVEQRLKVYERVLKRYICSYEFRPDDLKGLCLHLRGESGVQYKHLEKEFPEFMTYCPEDKIIGMFWFPFTYVGYCERIKILESCIEQCKIKINENKKHPGNPNPITYEPEPKGSSK